MPKILNKQEKAEILGLLLPQAQSYDELAGELETFVEAGKQSPEQKDMEAQLAGMAKEIQELLRRYLEGLPVRDLSRCPFTGEKFSLAIDDLGLDGLWWNFDAPKRPENQLLATYFALDGALKLGGEPERAPFLCSPGPDVPFVLPRLLEFVQVKAVLSSFKIGPHTAYPIVYYADPMLYGEKRVNDWGTKRYWETGSIIPELWTPGQYVTLTPDASEYDFDLASWIKAGKLLWIAPGDASLTLHGHISSCPYLDLPGSRRLKFIRDGKVWEDEEDYETLEPDDPDFDPIHFQKLVEEIERGEE
ncbi:hypothetical protein [Phosphitispora fastidiosa]|uniref:hypothetical protein n=1 Tax=Phosphitispora fastidiosa TaxID=2837202 RepID=UPI001E283C9B|nr:hypothetical protein [Phosphitispora fastidiosa]MBU7006560.1 hypothetical protein [Phosphitispora fastidiosa]